MYPNALPDNVFDTFRISTSIVSLKLCYDKAVNLKAKQPDTVKLSLIGITNGPNREI